MKSWSLNAKLSVVFAILIAGAGVITVSGIRGMAEINADVDELANRQIPRLGLAADLRGIVRQMTILQKNLILAESEARMVEFRKQVLELRADYAKTYEQLRAIAPDDLKQPLTDLAKDFDLWVTEDDKIAALAQAHKDKEANTLSLGEARETRARMERDLAAFITRDREHAKEAAANSRDHLEHGRAVMLSTAAGAILIGLLSAFFLLRSVGREIGKVIAQLRDNSQQVSAAARQIASSSEELSQAATEQAASLEETASAVEEMSSMVKRNAEGARQSAQISHASSGSAQRGKEVVGEMIRAMGEIDQANGAIITQINASNQRMSEIVKVIAEIGSKTKVINEIVFQTKLLSFNASVEAARAGEHGKGFAVVAEEVGNLAQMSGNAAKEISALLDGSIQKVDAIAAETAKRVEALVAEGKARVETGARVARECGRVLDEIVGNVGNVTRMVGDISTASDEQARGIEEITKAMTQLDQVTQQNASVSEEAASASEQLAAQAETLRNAVQVLIATVKGSEAADAAPAAAAPAPAVRTPTAAKAKIIPLRAQRVAAPRPSVTARAAGSELVPSEDDPRFKDV